ncbi:MAG: hypothetical protein NVS4B1_35430 [Ktedonobacteraceae bacterium]
MVEQVSYVIIGNGIAGVTAAEILREEDFAADITVIADDPFPVYYRPALKDYLAGRVREDKLWARSTSFYQDQRIRFLSERVVGIQVGQHSIQLQSGRQVGYSRLLLANGARASRLTCPGINLGGVTTLRTVDDYQAVVSRLNTAHCIVVSGSGTLALETIETLRHRGHAVTHLLRRRTLWSEVLDLTASDLVLQQERRDGVDVRVEEEIAEVTGKNGQVTGIVTTGGTRIPCDMVIIAIGVEPILDFIKSSGIPCGRGVQVNSRMQTSAPDIFAAGDVLETVDALTGRTRILGQWYPAIQQGRAAAYSMLNLLDTSRPFRSSTFFNATFLYGLDFSSVGLAQVPKDGKGYQEIVADPQPRTYRKVLLKDGKPVGALALGDRKGMLAFKRAIDHSVNLMPVASSLFARDFTLDAWLDQQGVPAPILGVTREGATARTYNKGGVSNLHVPVEAVLIPLAGEIASNQDAHKGQKSSREETHLSQTKVVMIGRQIGAHLLIDHGSVSRRHAEISYANGQYVLRDMGSANGTFVNDTRLEPKSMHILQANDQIRFGKVPFAFRVQGVDEVRAKAMTRTPGVTELHEMATGFFDPTAADQAPPSSGQPILNSDGSLLLPGASSTLPAAVVATFEESPALIVVTHSKPEVFYLKQGKSITLGRDKKNDIILAEVAASRKHAEVLPGLDGFYIRDMGSSNGVIVNSTRIDNPYRLAHSDRITIGSILIYFISVGALTREDANLIAPSQPSPSEAAQDTRAGVQCSNCGGPNIPIARFCANCGAPLQRRQQLKGR